MNWLNGHTLIDIGMIVWSNLSRDKLSFFCQFYFWHGCKGSETL